MNHCRLIYKSISSEHIVSNEDLRTLVQQSAQNNSEQDISGLLLLSGDEFLQVLEGTTRAVNELFRKILNDKRHHDVNLISFEPIGPVYFDDWSMRLVDLYDLPLAPRQFMMHKYHYQDGFIVIPDKLHEVYSLLLDAKALCHEGLQDEKAS